MAPLGLVQIRGRDHDGPGRRPRGGPGIPEFARDTGIRRPWSFIEKQNLGLGDQCADQRQLLFHTAAQTPRETIHEAIHIEHGDGSDGRVRGFFARNFAQVADVVVVFPRP